MRRLLAMFRRPDLSAVIAARLRAEQNDVIERWASALDMTDFDWINGKRK